VRADSVFVQVEGDHGWTTWTPVESLDDVGAEGAVYVLDREVGELTFGDGERSAVPPREAGVQANYGYGVGGSVPERMQ
jgi:hypothetical protein